MAERLKYIMCLVGFLSFAGCQQQEVIQYGSLYGIVVDKTTGESIRNAWVELMPIGLKTITGDDGQFEFTKAEEGIYNLYVTKSGYKDYKSTDIVIKASAENKPVNIQLEKLPPALTILDDNGKSINSIDFGDDDAQTIRSFNIFNNSDEPLEWSIEYDYDCDWIKSFSKEEGILSINATRTITCTIDRGKLSYGNNATDIYIVSNNGSKRLTIIAGKTTRVSFRGYVCDQDSIPISGASVYLKSNPNNKSVTDANGYYELTANIKYNTTYQIEASAASYNSLVMPFVTNEGTEFEQNFQLRLEILTDVDLGLGCWARGDAYMIFHCDHDSYIGQTKTRHILLRNYRKVPVDWEITNLPSKGVKLSQHSGVLPAEGDCLITVSITYPNANSPVFSLHRCERGGKTYVWDWDVVNYGYYNYNEEGTYNARFEQSDCCVFMGQIVYIRAGDDYGSFILIMNQMLRWQ